MSVLPSCVREYSSAMAFDFVTRFEINPADSRLRRVLMSMRCETLPRGLSPRPTHLNSIKYRHKRYYSDAHSDGFRSHSLDHMLFIINNLT